MVFCTISPKRPKYGFFFYQYYFLEKQVIKDLYQRNLEIIQPEVTCSKLTRETREQGAPMASF